MNKHKKILGYNGFTLVELVIVVTILAILSTIAFVSFSGYIGNARDSSRVFSIKEISKAITMQKQLTNKYPIPDEIYATGGVHPIKTDLFNVGLVGKNVSNFIKLEKVPLDPKSGTEYLYGLSKDNKYFQVAGTLENEQTAFLVEKAYANAGEQAVVEGNYKGVLSFRGEGTKKYIANIPSLIYSRTGTYSTNDVFVVNKLYNLPYKLDDKELTPVDLSSLLKEFYGSGSINTLTGIELVTGNEQEIIKISKDLGVSDLVVAEVIGNKDYLDKYASTGGNKGLNSTGGKVLKIIDFENPNDYTINPKSNFFSSYWSNAQFDNKLVLNQTQKQSGNNSVSISGGNNAGCVNFNFNSQKPFSISYSYKTNASEWGDITLLYKYNGSFMPQNEIDYRNFVPVDTLTDLGVIYNGVSGSEGLSDWKKTSINSFDYELRASLSNDDYFKAGNYEFEFCAEPSGGEFYIDDIVIEEYFVGSCATQPTYTNAVFNIGKPEGLNMSWQNTDSTAGCYYECKFGFDGNTCSNVLSVDLYDRLFKYFSDNKIPIYPSWFNNNTFVVNDKIYSVINKSIGNGVYSIVSIDNSGNIKDDYQTQNWFRGKLGNYLYFNNNSSGAYVLNMENGVLSKIGDATYYSHVKIIGDNAFVVGSDPGNTLFIYDINGNKTELTGSDFTTYSFTPLGILDGHLFYQDTKTYPNYYLKKINLSTKAITTVSTDILKVSSYDEDTRIFNNRIYYNDTGKMNKLRYLDSSGNVFDLSHPINFDIIYSNNNYLLVYDPNGDIFKVDSNNNIVKIIENVSMHPVNAPSWYFNNKYYVYLNGSGIDYITIDLLNQSTNTVNGEKVFIINENKLYKVLSPTSVEETSTNGTKKIRNNLNIVQDNQIPS